MQTRRHRSALTELDDAEVADLGRVAQAVSGEMQEITGAARVYVYLLNEAEPPHVHLHVVARLREDPVELRGPALLSAGVPAGAGFPPESALTILAEARRRLGI
ncbi:hypothetical protein KZZ52_15845 [Dactylosporangium sp. AC04546]|uniref:HIT family protein n=1 Tax=Dactylosporangium sp. AC04546 TaxID=2862460 RepID=UPI001EDF15AB|nr:hypothetical protein [Dactylosporangium sp. AC04546]WVK86775.1 hypothetical protein KZZ52_15845 [Dactylosporangium sp. AC04546]